MVLLESLYAETIIEFGTSALEGYINFTYSPTGSIPK
jgi:hypothetical protein